MQTLIQIDLRLPEDLAILRLPNSLNRRLTYLLDCQDSGRTLTEDERSEAEGIISVGEALSLLRLRAERAAEAPKAQTAKG